MKTRCKSFFTIFRNHPLSSKFAKPFSYIVLILSLLFFLPLSQVFAADIDVGTGCTLAQAISSANADQSNRDTGNCDPGSGADTITLSGDVTLSTALPNITSTITIEGGEFTIDGNNAHRIFDVRNGNLTLNSLTLTKGYADNGGALRLIGGSLTINNSIIRDSEAESENSGNGQGGGLYHNQGTTIINNSSFINNEADISLNSTGGAISIHNRSPLSAGNLTINNSTFRDNKATDGGAIIIEGGTAKITNSTFTNNKADGGKGGAIWNTAVGATTTLTHVTVVGNTANEQGGVYDPNRIYNSIIANNTGNGSADDCRGTGLTSSSGSLIESGSRCGSPAVTSDPKLGELTGSPAYFPLLAGSPAIDAADTDKCDELNPKVDQRGASRWRSLRHRRI